MTPSGQSGTCWKCERELSGGDYGRRESCADCGSDTKVCRNCAHYSPKLNNECRETIAEAVQDKEKANFCEFFRPDRPPASGSAAPYEDKASKNAFDALFKKKK